MIINKIRQNNEGYFFHNTYSSQGESLGGAVRLAGDVLYYHLSEYHHDNRREAYARKGQEKREFLSEYIRKFFLDGDELDEDVINTLTDDLVELF